jgi:hypothetical protein
VTRIATVAPMPRDLSAHTASTKAELGAIGSVLDQCRERLSALAVSRGLAVNDPDDPSGDDLLTAIYEAERGVSAAARLVERAAR